MTKTRFSVVLVMFSGLLVLLGSTSAWRPSLSFLRTRADTTTRARLLPKRSSETCLAAIADDATQKLRGNYSSGLVPTGVTLKIALDAVGAAADLAEIKSERFTCPESLDMVHRLRCVSDAVLVGRGTVEADNPSLTVRRVPCDRPQPLRVVLDPRLSLVLEEFEEGLQFQLLDDGMPTVIYHCVRDVDDSSLNLLESVTCVYLPPPPLGDESGHNQEESIRPGMYLSVKDVLNNLSHRFGVKHLMVEGGPTTARLFLQSRLVDRAILVKAPLCFRKPLDAGLSDTLLEQAGLKFVGKSVSGEVDTIEYWSRPDLAWPTEEFKSWP